MKAPVESKRLAPARAKGQGAGCGRLRRAVAPLVAAALCAIGPLAAARPLPQQADPSALDCAPAASVVQRGSISLEQATAMAAQLYQGRVVRAETKMRGGRIEHEIRILGADNRVRIVRVDAETGQIR